MKKKYPSLKGVHISYHSSSAKPICFYPEVAEELCMYFHWGENHPANICEQMVAAVGYCMEDCAWVEEVIPVPLWNRGKNTAEFSVRHHEYILNEIELLNRNLTACSEACFESDKSLCLLGYIHSHPGELKAAMSSPDLELHHQMNKEGATTIFTGIINPHRKDLCIYWDSLYSPNDILLIVEENDVAKWKC